MYFRNVYQPSQGIYTGIHRSIIFTIGIKFTMSQIPPDRLRRLRRMHALVEDQVVLVALVRRRHEMQERRRRRRQFWVKPWIQRRALFGTYDQLMMELERESHGDFKGYMRMEPVMFHELVDRLTPRIQKRKTNCRSPLSPGLRLAVTLRYLATGDAYRNLKYSFRVPHNTTSGIVKEVCAAIVEEFAPEVFTTPSTPDRYIHICEIALVYIDVM
jgi:hypothetical protein